MGGCGSHIRAKSTLSTFKHPWVEYSTTLESSSKGSGSSPRRFADINGTDEYPNSTPKLTSASKSTDLQFSPTTDNNKPLSISNLCLFELSPRHDQIRECSIKFVAANFPTENEIGGSVRITFPDSSTSSEYSAKECSSVGNVETWLNPANQQSQLVGFEATNLPPEIGEQLRKFLSADNPEAKAAATKLLELVTKLPKLESRQRAQLAHMLKRSLDQNSFIDENMVKITGEPDDDPSFYDSSNSSCVSVENEKIQQNCEFFKLSGSKTVGNEKVLTHDVSDSGDTTGDEKIKSSDIDLVEFSKRQVIRSRRKSMEMSQSLESMPSLTQSLAEPRGWKLKESCYDFFQDNEVDIDLESISSKIDELDLKIGKSTRKLSELRTRSLDFLTGVVDSETHDWNGKKLSFVSGEQEIIRWQNHKNKLVDERNQIVVKLRSQLFDKITSTPLIYSPTKSGFPYERDTSIGTPSDTKMPSNRLKSDSITESLSSLVKLDLPDIVA